MIGCGCGSVTPHLHKAEPSPSLINPALIENEWQPVTAAAVGVNAAQGEIYENIFISIFSHMKGKKGRQRKACSFNVDISRRGLTPL